MDIHVDDSRRRRINADVTLRKIVIAASATCVIVNCSILTISAFSGHWLFGYLCCQLFALLSQVLVAGSAWMIALASIERCYRYVSPTEHAMTFSDINVRLLAYGTYLLLIVLHTSPLYGWGEYSQFRGGLRLIVDMIDASTANSTAAGSDNFIVLPFNDTVGCSEQPPKMQFNPENVADIIQYTFEKMYICDVRYIAQSSLIVLLRFSAKDYLDKFMDDFNDEKTGQIILESFRSFFQQCNQTLPQLLMKFDIQKKSYNEYKDVHLPFQEIGICSLDFSSVNHSIASWIPFLVVTTAVIPYGTTFFCCVIVRLSTKRSNRREIQSPVCLIVGSVLGLISTVPYYYVNISNYKDIYIDHTFNVIATVLYYCNSLSFVILSSCFGDSACLTCIRAFVRRIRTVDTDGDIMLQQIGCYDEQIVQGLTNAKNV